MRARISKRRSVLALTLAVSLSVGTLTPMAAPQAAAAEVQIPVIAEAQGLPGFPTPVAHVGAPDPTPFPASYLLGYISDISSYPGGNYTSVISEFNDLKANHPEVLQENLDKAIAINNAAADNPELIAQAQADARADEGGLLTQFSDAFGAELGEYLRQALAENRLPKTTFLLDSGHISRAGGIASSTAAEKAYYDYDRPFVIAPDQICYYDAGDGYEYYDPDSKSFPSGHTNQAAWVTTLLAVMVPELAPQILARGSEAGYDRLVMGVHYPLDVIGGRMTGTAAAADRWNDPKMRDAITQAAAELRAELEWRAGRSIAEVVATDTPYLSADDAVALYTERMTYGFEKIRPTDAQMIVPQAAPDLLLTKYPDLSYEQRAQILADTAIGSGAPLDDQSTAGSWQRVNLAAAFAA